MQCMLNMRTWIFWIRDNRDNLGTTESEPWLETQRAEVTLECNNLKKFHFIALLCVGFFVWLPPPPTAGTGFIQEMPVWNYIGRSAFKPVRIAWWAGKHWHLSSFPRWQLSVEKTLLHVHKLSFSSQFLCPLKGIH